MENNKKNDLYDKSGNSYEKSGSMSNQSSSNSGNMSNQSGSNSHSQSGSMSDKNSSSMNHGSYNNSPSGSNSHNHPSSEKYSQNQGTSNVSGAADKQFDQMNDRIDEGREWKQRTENNWDSSKSQPGHSTQHIGDKKNDAYNKTDNTLNNKTDKH